MHSLRELKEIRSIYESQIAEILGVSLERVKQLTLVQIADIFKAFEEEFPT